MKYITKLKLAAVHQLCDVEDRSTEYMIQIMQDIVKVNHDAVIAYLSLSENEIDELRRGINEVIHVAIQAEKLIPRGAIIDYEDI